MDIDPVERTNDLLQEAWAVAALLEDEVLAARVRRLTRLLDVVRELPDGQRVPAQRGSTP